MIRRILFQDAAKKSAFAAKIDITYEEHRWRPAVESSSLTERGSAERAS